MNGRFLEIGNEGYRDFLKEIYTIQFDAIRLVVREEIRGSHRCENVFAAYASDNTPLNECKANRTD